jgi:glycine/D-amino acid oxidase-like deaminating enzyme
VTFDAETTEQADLRGGRSPWLAGMVQPARPILDRSMRCDVLIVGAGITGSLMAEHLTARGRQVCVIDRERAGFGSTAASTAMLMWEIDRSLADLTRLYGFERAADIYRRSFAAVTGLRALVDRLGRGWAFRPRSSLYLAAGDVGARALIEEHALRERAGLPGVYLDYPQLRAAFGFDREAAILSPGSADADPLLLAHGLIAAAMAEGAAVYDAMAVDYESVGQGVAVTLDNGCIVEARRVVLATGYVMPDFIETDLHATASSWAIATPPQTGNGAGDGADDALWRDGVLIWEASDDYLYARTTTDGRIIIGGEDEDSIVEPDARDALMPDKAETLLRKLKLLRPGADATADFVWSGAFGQTSDGLPLIGPVPGRPGLFAAYGYGGNGITFSYLASRLVGRMIDGEHEAWFDAFAIDRPSPPA